MIKYKILNNNYLIKEWKLQGDVSIADFDHSDYFYQTIIFKDSNENI